jgi:hypothetical protein
MSIVEARKIDLAEGVLSTLTDRGISIDDRIDIITLVLKSLNAKKRKYSRRNK